MKLKISFKKIIKCLACDNLYEIETNNSKLKYGKFKKYCDGCLIKIEKGELKKIHKKYINRTEYFKKTIKCLTCDNLYEIEINNYKFKHGIFKKYCDGCLIKIEKRELKKIYKKHTNETKLKLSKLKTEFYKNNPEKHPNVRCAHNIESYPEKFFRLFLELNGCIKNVDFIQNYKINKYYVDFYFPTLNLGIEIDGERWHNRNDKKEIDRENIIKHSINLKRFWSKKLIKKEYEEEILEIIYASGRVVDGTGLQNQNG